MKEMAYCCHCGKKVEVRNPKGDTRESGVVTLDKRCPLCGFSDLFIPAEGKIPITEIEFELPPAGVGLRLETPAGLQNPPFPSQAKMRFASTVEVMVLCDKLLNSLLRKDLEFFPARKEDIIGGVLNLCVGILKKNGYKCVAPETLQGSSDSFPPRFKSKVEFRSK